MVYADTEKYCWRRRRRDGYCADDAGSARPRHSHDSAGNDDDGFPGQAPVRALADQPARSVRSAESTPAAVRKTRFYALVTEKQYDEFSEAFRDHRFQSEFR